MEDIIIIEKIKRMISDMTSVPEVNVIVKYSINAAKMMQKRNSKNLYLLENVLPYGMHLQVMAALRT